MSVENDNRQWFDATTYLPPASDVDRRLTGPRIGDPVHERDVARRWRDVPAPVRALDTRMGFASSIVWGYAQRCIARVDYRDDLARWENEGGPCS